MAKEWTGKFLKHVKYTNTSRYINWFYSSLSEYERYEYFNDAMREAINALSSRYTIGRKDTEDGPKDDVVSDDSYEYYVGLFKNYLVDMFLMAYNRDQFLSYAALEYDYDVRDWVVLYFILLLSAHNSGLPIPSRIVNSWIRSVVINIYAIKENNHSETIKEFYCECMEPTAEQMIEADIHKSGISNRITFHQLVMSDTTNNEHRSFSLPCIFDISNHDYYSYYSNIHDVLVYKYTCFYTCEIACEQQPNMTRGTEKFSFPDVVYVVNRFVEHLKEIAGNYGN